MLDRLAKHHVDLHLSFPDECNCLKVVVRVPPRHRERDKGVGHAERGSSFCTMLDVAVDDKENEAWDCSANAVTDGKFLYPWHPNLGLIKAWTGLRRTMKGRLYTENTGTGRLNAGFTLTVALGADVTPRPRHTCKDASGALARRAADRDCMKRGRVGSLEGWNADEGGTKEGNTHDSQPRRLLVHYTWRGLHDVESFSEKQSIDLPSARVCRAWHRRAEVNRLAQGVSASGVTANEEPLAQTLTLDVLSVSHVTFGEALEVLSHLRRGRA